MVENEVVRTMTHTDWGIIWRIYRDSFPLHEQRQEQHQQAKMLDPNFHCQIFRQNGKILGFIFWWECNELVYIEHFAINPALRGQNYGSHLLATFCKTVGRNVILEIDPPEDEVSIRRLRFYQTLGFCLNDYPHVHPAYQPSYEGHVLRVLSHPNPLSNNEYNKFKRLLEVQVMVHN